MIFISASVENADSILARARGESILTVGEAEGFTDAGGIIGFHVEKNRVRFGINLEAARIDRLQFRSQLLKLADVVRSDP
jgi:hypothetical protein